MTLSTPVFLATDARAYEHFMARWSRRLAGPFLDFAGVKGGNRVLDVGCGTGVITAALAERRRRPHMTFDARRPAHRRCSDEIDACVSALAIGAAGSSLAPGGEESNKRADMIFSVVFDIEG